MSKSVLLIGGAGYIGPVIAEKLLLEGYRVSILDNLIYDNGFSLEKLQCWEEFRFIKGDMGDRKKIIETLIGIDNVVLLAGLVGDPITKKYPKLASKINGTSVQSCINLLSSMDLDRVIFISTCSNYGLIPDNHLADEEYPLSPVSSYAKSKVEAEKLIVSLGDNGNFSPTILRFATAFGVAPRTRFDLTVNEFTRELFYGRQVEVFDPDTWRPYCHVKDFAEIIKLVLSVSKEKVKNEIFNAGSVSNNFTKRQVINLISENIPNSRVVFRKHGTDPRNYKVDFSKIRNKLNFTSSYTLEAGVVELIAYLEGKPIDFYSGNENYLGNYSLAVK